MPSAAPAPAAVPARPTGAGRDARGEPSSEPASHDSLEGSDSGRAEGAAHPDARDERPGPARGGDKLAQLTEPVDVFGDNGSSGEPFPSDSFSDEFGDVSDGAPLSKSDAAPERPVRTPPQQLASEDAYSKDSGYSPSSASSIPFPDDSEETSPRAPLDEKELASSNIVSRSLARLSDDTLTLTAIAPDGESLLSGTQTLGMSDLPADDFDRSLVKDAAYREREEVVRSRTREELDMNMHFSTQEIDFFVASVIVELYWNGVLLRRKGYTSEPLVKQTHIPKHVMTLLFGVFTRVIENDLFLQFQLEEEVGADGAPLERLYITRNEVPPLPLVHEAFKHFAHAEQEQGSLDYVIDRFMDEAVKLQFVAKQEAHEAATIQKIQLGQFPLPPRMPTPTKFSMQRFFEDLARMFKYDESVCSSTWLLADDLFDEMLDEAVTDAFG